MKRPPRRADDQLITPWVFFRYMVVGLYVGFATVGVFAYWYIWYDWSEYGHPLVSYTQLSNWGKCPDFGSDPAYYGVYSPSFTTWAKHGGLDLSSDPCKYMTGKGKDTASTMSLSVLVTIEMFNAGSASRDTPDLIT